MFVVNYANNHQIRCDAKQNENVTNYSVPGNYEINVVANHNSYPIASPNGVYCYLSIGIMCAVYFSQ